MKILLFNPPRSPENKILEYAPPEAQHFVHKKLIGPPLGLLTIAAAVRDHEVKVIDLKGEYDLNPCAPKLDALVLSYLTEFNPEVVGVTFNASEFYYGIEIFRVAKLFNPDILTVAGGLHATLCKEDFNNDSVDIVCPGHSAYVFRMIIQAKELNVNFDNIPGIFLNTENGLIPSNQPAIEWDAAGAHFIMPDRSHLKRWISTYKVGQSTDPSTYIFTSLGCPYECTFCSIWPVHNKKFFQRNLESIIEELKSVDEYPVVRFSDANTIVNTHFINKLFDRIVEEGIKKTYIMDIRTDTVSNNPKLIEKLAKAGLKVVICGFESFREKELKKYNKKTTPDNIFKTIEILHNNDIMIRGNYVIPNDYGEDDFKALSDYSSQHKVAYAGYTILTPMPGTLFYHQMKDQIIDHDLSKYNFFNSVLKTKIPLEKFYENLGKLWLIKKGDDII